MEEVREKRAASLYWTKKQWGRMRMEEDNDEDEDAVHTMDGARAVVWVCKALSRQATLKVSSKLEGTRDLRESSAAYAGRSLGAGQGKARAVCQ